MYKTTRQNILPVGPGEARFSERGMRTRDPFSETARHYAKKAGSGSTGGKGKPVVTKAGGEDAKVKVNIEFIEKIVKENGGGPKAQFKAFEEAKRLVGEVKAFEALCNSIALRDALAGIGASDKRAEAAARIVLTTIGGMSDTNAKKLAVEAGYDFGPANRGHTSPI